MSFLCTCFPCHTWFSSVFALLASDITAAWGPPPKSNALLWLHCLSASPEQQKVVRKRQMKSEASLTDRMFGKPDRNVKNSGFTRLVNARKRYVYSTHCMCVCVYAWQAVTRAESSGFASQSHSWEWVIDVCTISIEKQVQTCPLWPGWKQGPK